MSRPKLSRFLLIVIVLLLAGSVLPPQVAQGQAATPTPAAGYTYTIQRGDSWSRISRQTGVPVATLKANNPQAIHPQDWLYQGERLFIPEGAATQSAPQSAADTGFWYQVKAGDAWGSVAKANGVTVQALLTANPSQVQPNRWLFTGQWIWIPGADSPTAPDRVTITATSPPTLTPSLTAMPSPTATSTATATPEPTATLSATPTVEPAVASATPGEQDALSAVTEAAATVAAAAESAGLAASAAQSAATAVAAANSIATSVAALSTQIALLNLATTPVVVTPTAVATVTETPEEPSATQAPATATQPAPTETRPAPTATRAATSTHAVAPTTVATRTRIPTRTPTTAPTSAAQTMDGCLLDKVIVANQAFDRWGQDGFQTAIKLYQDVLADTTSKACGKTANELVLLRDYARFRLLISYVTSGQAKLAEPLYAQIKDPVVKGAADTFLEGLKTSGSIVQSCRYVIASVQAKPADWRWLTELGLPAKPADLCPMG